MSAEGVSAYCVDCGHELDPVTVDAAGDGVRVGVAACMCVHTGAVSRTAVVDRAIDLARSINGGVVPGLFIEYCRAIETYINDGRPRSERHGADVGDPE